MKSFSIFPHKGYLNTDFQIKVFGDNPYTFYYDNNIPIENSDSFRLPAGIHRIKSDISGEEFDEVEVEDAIRLGGSKVEAGYCFDNSPWAVAVMKDRTYFLNSNTGNQYLENGLSPLSVSALSERLLLFTYGTIDESGIAKIVEYSVFDVTQGVSIGRFDNYILHNTEISVFSDAPTDDGICLHVMRYSEVSVIIDIPCKTYTIFDGMIYYCAISDDKFMVMRLQSDGTQEGIQYCSGPQSEFVGFVMNHYYVRRSGKYFYLKDFITVSNYIGESIHNHGGVIREINGVNVQKTDLVDDFYKLVVNNKDVCSRLDLHTQIIDVTLYETSEGIYEKAICHNYSWLDYNYKRPSVSCELNILGCGDSISIDRYDSIYCADNFIILNKLDTIRIIQHGKCVRELTNVTLRSTPNGMYIYVNENDEIRSVYKVGALSDELIVQGCKENIHLSFVEKYGILTENSKHYRIYNIDNDKWENLPHQKYLLMEKIGKCFLQDTDDDGQGYFLQYNYIPVTLPIRVSDILSITTNGSLIMSQSPRGIIVHERFLGSVPYRINEKLCEVIDTDEYRNALFSDDGSHTIYNKNGTWYYYDISTGSELEFEMEPEISKRQIHGLYCMNFYTRFNDTDRRIGLVDPISLQIVPPVYIDDYVFVSPSGKLASKTHIAGVKIRYFLTNSDRRTKDIVLRREVTDILNKTELMLLESNIRHLEFAFPGSQKEDWEKEMITSLVNRIGGEETPSDRYCLYARKDALIDIFSTEKEDKVIQIELPVNLGYLNSIIFSPDDKYVSICGKTVIGGTLQRGFVGVFDLVSLDWVLGPETPNLAVWKSFFSASGMFAYYNSRPNAMCGNFNSRQLKEIAGRSVLTFSRSGKYIAMSDKGYIPYAVNPSNWGHMRSANIYVRCVDGEKELGYTDHGAEIVGLYNKDVTCVSFSPDDKRLLSVSQDGVIIIRNLHLEELQEEDEITESQRGEIRKMLEETDESCDPSDWLYLTEKYYYEGEGIFYTKDRKKIIACTDDTMEEYCVKDGCEVICDEAFDPCIPSYEAVMYAEDTKTEVSYGNKLSIISLPPSVNQIGKDAFSFCENLKEIRVPFGCLDKFKQMISPEHWDKLVEV